MPKDIYLHLIGWGIPLLITIISFATQSYAQFGPPYGCWLSNDVLSLAYSIPMFACLCLNVVFLTITTYRLFKLRVSSNKTPLKNKGKIMLAIQTCFVVYLTGLALELLSPPLQTPFNVGMILNALQGFLDATAISGVALWQRYNAKKTPDGEEQPKENCLCPILNIV